MKTPAWLQEVLSNFENKAEPHGEMQIVDGIDLARKTPGDLSDEEFKAYVAERSAFCFRGRPDKDDVWGTFFGPLAVGTKDDGTDLRVPDIKELDDEVVAHWEERARSVKHPVMQARYADLVWDLKRAITHERASHEFAQIAVDAYLMAIRKRIYTMEFEALIWVRRALSIALSIQDKDRTKQAVTSILELSDQLAQRHRSGCSFLAFDELYGRKDLLSPEQETKIISDLESMLARTSSGKPEEFDPHLAQSAAERLAQHYKRQNDRNNVVRVIKTYGEAFVRLSKDAAPMLAAAWLQPVIERYEQEGLKQDAERLQLIQAEKAKGIVPNLKTISLPITIEKSDIDELIEHLLGENDLKISLLRIAHYFIPKADQAREFLEKMRTEAPLLSTIPVGIVATDGHTSATIDSVGEDPEGRLHMQLGQTMGFCQPFLVFTLERLREQYKPSVDDILNFLGESPLFANSDLTLLREGLNAYEKEDFVKTIHVLVPQIEHVLRGFLGGLGVPTLKTVRNHPGIMDTKGMNDILREERLRSALTENLWRYLTVLFIEKKGGLNLRNDLAHGLLPPGAFSRQIADQVFHSLLALSLMRRPERTEMPSPQSASCS